MLWDLEWGKQELFLRRLQERGKYVEALETRPGLPDHLVFVWNIWNELHSARQVGMGVNPLSISDIKSALELEFLDGEIQQDVYQCVRRLDQVWCEHAIEKLQQKEKPKDGNSRPNNARPKRARR